MEYTIHPTEDQEQAQIFAEIEYLKNQYPELVLLFHIPNGANTNKITGALNKRKGLKSGVPDLFLPVARHGYHGLFIELKAVGGVESKTQKEWRKNLNLQGYKSVVCVGCEEAIEILLDYMK